MLPPAHDCPHRRDPYGNECWRPHVFAPHAADAPEPEHSEAPKNGTNARAKVISFGKGKKKLLEGIEVAEARAARGYLTPAEGEELILLAGRLVQIGMAAAESSNGSGVPSEDFDAGEARDVSAETSEGIENEDCDFSPENEQFAKATEDKFIRVDGSPRPASQVTLDEFLSAFFPDPYEDINLRAFGPKDALPEPRFSAEKIPTLREALACDRDLLDSLATLNRTRGLYFVVNSGGDLDKDVTRFNAFFAEMDTGALTEQHAKLDACPLPPVIRLETLKSVHAYWLAAPGVTEAEWREVMRRLIHYLGSDAKIKNPSRVMRLPGFNHVSYNAGLLSYKPVTLSHFDPSRRFTATEMLAAFPEVPNTKPKREPRRATLDELAGGFGAWKRELGQRIMGHDSARRNSRGNWDCRALCHDGKGSTGLFYNPAENSIGCNAENKCNLDTIAAAFHVAPYRGDAA